MIELCKAMFRNQYEAAFRTLKYCVDLCPDELWNKPVCNVDYSQVAFHTLFFTDVYLGPNPEAVETQPFHKEHASVFAGYEEWEDRKPEKRYERAFIEAYLEHCLEKARVVVDAFTETQLKTASGFYWIEGMTAEVHVYNIRHIQHHAAQLSLRARLDHGVDIPWVKSGWGS